MLPDSKQLPEWVRWVAQDADGSWWAYELEPNMSDSGWYENEVGQILQLHKDAPNPFWRDQLHAVKKI